MEPEPTDDIVIIHITPEELVEFPKEIPQENKICFSPEKKKKTRNQMHEFITNLSSQPTMKRTMQIHQPLQQIHHPLVFLHKTSKCL